MSLFNVTVRQCFVVTQWLVMILSLHAPPDENHYSADTHMPCIYVCLCVCVCVYWVDTECPLPYIVRPHQSIAFIDEACCVMDGVVWSICRLVSREHCKTTELIEILFGMWARVGAGKHVLDGMYVGATC